MKNLPNILTTIRFCLVPVFPIVYFSDMKNAHYIALIIFLIASLTDFLDGYFARKYNVISKIGIVMDPLADKFMQLTALTSLTLAGALPLWILIIFLAKEFFIIITGTILYWRRENKMVIPSHIIGKIATVVSSLAVTLLIIFPANKICISVAVIALALKLIALVMYIKVYRINKQQQL
ncbi:MAG: CDP-diacylglycerol--glycerol-3-phosphate 3-phosphatidyltransferase [Vallitaleaceae bacterium]|jgi:cardiolipin synthase|nr:CDP-diacylglycerol--glycerol-3-phosphate 3-phosphatidyltransferase [Vallitaleaceae bacterium]